MRCFKKPDKLRIDIGVRWKTPGATGGVMKLVSKIRAVLGILLLCACGTALSQANLKGRDFLRLSPPRPVATGERIEIIEFFYYGCPICYEFQPHL